MKVYTYSEARQHFSSILDEAQRNGGVRVTRRDGRAFVIKPEVATTSPLAVRAATTRIGRDEIVASVREGRDR